MNILSPSRAKLHARMNPAARAAERLLHALALSRMAPKAISHSACSWLGTLHALYDYPNQDDRVEVPLHSRK